MPTQQWTTLFELADPQKGYFTTAQASRAGVSRNVLAMMARRGTAKWISQGVYRLVDYPVSALDQYMEAVLWPGRTSGVVSHASALELIGLSDVNPGKIHITVPARFRIQRPVPAYLAVHHEDLDPDEISVHDGIPVTSVERAIRDAAADHLGPALIGQAIKDGLAQGYLNTQTASALSRELLPSKNASR